MADEADKPIPQFLSLVGIALIGAALEAMLTSSGFHQTIPYLVILFGIFLFFAGYYWSYFKTFLGATVTALIVRVETDSRVWFGLEFALIAYMLTMTAIQSIQLNEMPSIKSELASLRADVNRYLVPRRLTPEQTSKIAKYLSRYDPQKITFDVVRDDQEAASHRGELQRALEDRE